MNRNNAIGVAALLLLLGGTGSAAGQRLPASGELTPELAATIIAFHNRPGTIRLTGDAAIPAGVEVAGDLAVLAGSLRLDGTVRGGVLVINGNAVLGPAARIDGDLTVVGGTVLGFTEPAVGGRAAAYAELLRYRRSDGLLVQLQPRARPTLVAGRPLPFGRLEFTAGVPNSYNRVEGLPVAFGPRFESHGSNPTRLEALAIYRTESGLRLDPGGMGHHVRLTQHLGGRRAARAGLVLRSEVVPIEAWGLSDKENSLATFLLHRDYRDHYGRRGWGAFAEIGLRDSPLEAALEYAEETHRTRAAAGPWAFFGNQREWRPQPVVATGDLRSLALRFAYDSRNEGREPSTGWFVRGRLEQGLGGTLSTAIVLDTVAPPLPGERPENTEFTHLLLDARRYERVGPTSRVAFRLLAAGALDGRSLPPQRQHTLGGEGSLPAFGLFEFDCGARQNAIRLGWPLATTRFFPFYGCDHLLLGQAEFTASFPLGGAVLDRLGLDLDLRDTVGWVAFVNAGRAWTERDARHGRQGGQETFAADLGVGFRLGPLGAYWAVPLSSGGQGPNFFMRVGSRL
jgi:hypothetical protein